uniref:Uncharacterized protein n=1 Tax=Populus trichocarpa TaxID=3694 RepID=A0A2K2CCK4_POPTR
MSLHPNFKTSLTHFTTQFIYNNTNNKNIFYHYILHKPYTHTILISSKHVIKSSFLNVLLRLAIDSNSNNSSTSNYFLEPNGHNIYHRVVYIISQN